MFFKKKCSRCEKKVSKEDQFCPNCGFKLEGRGEEDYGLIGKEDSLRDQLKLPFGFNTLFNSLFKELDKQFKELDKIELKNQPKNIKQSGISISISSSGQDRPEIKIKTFGNTPQAMSQEAPKKILVSQNIPEETIKKFSQIPREEAQTTVRRLSNKIVYEITLPGVSDIKNVFINQLEHSIEIKAMSKNKAYFKLIPVSFPVKKYALKDETLVLELDARD